jgi:hypothetical protein
MRVMFSRFTEISQICRETSDVQVFNPIFRSVDENLLKA